MKPIAVLLVLFFATLHLAACKDAPGADRRAGLPRSRFAQSWIALEHIPSGRNRPDGICLLQRISPVRAFPFRWNRACRAMG